LPKINHKKLIALFVENSFYFPNLLISV